MTRRNPAPPVLHLLKGASRASARIREQDEETEERSRPSSRSRAETAAEKRAYERDGQDPKRLEPKVWAEYDGETCRGVTALSEIVGDGVQARDPDWWFDRLPDAQHLVLWLHPEGTYFAEKPRHIIGRFVRGEVRAGAASTRPLPATPSEAVAVRLPNGTFRRADLMPISVSGYRVFDLVLGPEDEKLREAWDKMVKVPDRNATPIKPPAPARASR